MVVKAKFEFPRMLEGDQYLFLSEDFDMLLELYSGEAMLYRLENTLGTVDKTVVYKRRLMSLPIGYVNGNAYQLYCLFSPNLTMHFDVDPRDQCWIIRDATKDKPNRLRKIPQTLIAFNKWNPNQILE